jgi:hypothetical protein
MSGGAGEFHHVDVVTSEERGFSGGAWNTERFGNVSLREQRGTTLPHQPHKNEKRNVEVGTIKRLKFISRPCSAGETRSVDRDSNDDSEQDRHSEQKEQSRWRGS